jgi:hypothetical protein
MPEPTGGAQILDSEGARRYHEASTKYRQSGLGLMTTVIGLSSGGVYALADKVPAVFLAILFLPIALALWQEMEQYLGDLNQSFAEGYRRALELNDVTKAWNEEHKATVFKWIGEKESLAFAHYYRSEFLTVATIAVFIVLGFAAFAVLLSVHGLWSPLKTA